MNIENEKEISVEQFKVVVKKYWFYFLSKWKWIISVAIIAGIAGIVYASFKKPVYIAEITFVGESEGSATLGGYAGLAAQFGIDAGGSSGAFAGDNLIELMHSKLLIEKTLLSNVDINGKNQLLINYYIARNGYDVIWSKNALTSNVKFSGTTGPTDRVKDSILQSIITDLSTNSLSIGRVNKKLDYISAKALNEDELFAKTFIELLVKNVIQYYVDYRSQKSRQNIDILKRQTDSVRSMLSGNIADIATSNDLNVNPIRQVMRTGVQRKQVDVQVNSALYGELVKNLELSRIALRRETPLILIIDTPRLPLQKKKLSRLMTGIAFGFIGGMITLVYFFFKKMLDL